MPCLLLNSTSTAADETKLYPLNAYRLLIRGLCSMRIQESIFLVHVNDVYKISLAQAEEAVKCF